MKRSLLPLIVVIAMATTPSLAEAKKVPPQLLPGATVVAFYADQANILKYSKRRAAALCTIGGLNPDYVVANGDSDHRTSGPNGWEQMWDDITSPTSAAGTDWFNCISPYEFDTNPDDHDGAGCNNANASCPHTPEFVDAFKTRWPGPYPTSSLLRIRTLPNLLVLLTDTRTQRSRNSAPDGPNKIMYAQDQEDEIVAQVAAAPSEIWVLLVSTVPWHDGKVKDSWQGFPTARARLALRLAPYCLSGKKCIWVTADVHNRGGLHNGICLPECAATCAPGNHPEVSIHTSTCPPDAVSTSRGSVAAGQRDRTPVRTAPGSCSSKPRPRRS